MHKLSLFSIASQDDYGNLVFETIRSPWCVRAHLHSGVCVCDLVCALRFATSA